MKIPNNGTEITVQGLWKYIIGKTYTKGDIILVGDNVLPYYVLKEFTATSNNSYLQSDGNDPRTKYYIDYLNDLITDNDMKYMTYSQFYDAIKLKLDGITGDTIDSIQYSLPSGTFTSEAAALSRYVINNIANGRNAAIRLLSNIGSGVLKGRFIVRTYKISESGTSVGNESYMVEMTGMDSTNACVIICVGKVGTTTLSPYVLGLGTNGSQVLSSLISDLDRANNALDNVLGSSRFIHKIAVNDTNPASGNFSFDIPTTYNKLDYIEFILEQTYSNKKFQTNSQIAIQAISGTSAFMNGNLESGTFSISAEFDGSKFIIKRSSSNNYIIKSLVIGLPITD